MGITSLDVDDNEVNSFNQDMNNLDTGLELTVSDLANMSESLNGFENDDVQSTNDVNQFIDTHDNDLASNDGSSDMYPDSGDEKYSDFDQGKSDDGFFSNADGTDEDEDKDALNSQDCDSAWEEATVGNEQEPCQQQADDYVHHVYNEMINSETDGDKAVESNECHGEESEPSKPTEIEDNEARGADEDEESNEYHGDEIEDYEARGADEHEESSSEDDDKWGSQEEEEDFGHARRVIFDWLDGLSKRLDFIYNHEEPIFNHPTEGHIKNYEGIICDPYFCLNEPDLQSQIVEIRSLVDGSTLNRLQGRCWVRLAGGTELHGSWKNGRRFGAGGITSPALERCGVTAIAGNYTGGVIQGPGRMHMSDGSLREGWFHVGRLHGPTRGVMKGGDFVGVSWVGWYHRGQVQGVHWERMEGGGWLVSRIGPAASQTAFIYPDLSTALLGVWSSDAGGEKRLVWAHPARIQGTSQFRGLLVPQLKVTDNVIFKRWVSPREEIVCPLHQRDPYEVQYVKVDQSRVNDGGDGLFSVRDTPANTLVAMYNGVRYPAKETSLHGKTGYAIYVDWETRESREKSDIVDLPKQYQSICDYSATSGHKVNHSFNPNCEWIHFNHPVFGRVPAVRTIKEVKAGDELFVHYGMDMEEAPEWYLDCWESTRA